MIAIGFFAAKRRIIDENLKEGICRLVFSITLPLMIFTGLMHTHITPSLLKNGALVIVLAYFSLLLLFATGILSSRLLKLDRRRGSIHSLHTMFGNHVFLGFPLINALFPGGEGLFYATLFYLASTSLMWTLGVYVMNREKNQSLVSNLKHLLNPNTFAFILGFIFMLAGLRLPGVIDQPLTGMGNATTYLSMLYIGSMLAQISIRGVFTRLNVFVMCFNKLLLIPFVLILFTGFLGSTILPELSQQARSVVILQAGMPAMAVVVVLARRFGADDMLATENLFVSTILSLVTLPFVYYLISVL